MKYAATGLSILGLGFGLLLHYAEASEGGPSPAAVKAAFSQAGISAGATFSFGGHVYHVRSLNVSKGGLNYHVTMDATLAE